MIIDARQIATESPDAEFEFIGMDGKKYTLPNIATVPLGEFDRLTSEGIEGLRDLVSADTLDAFMQMSRYTIIKILEAWGESGGDAGKEGPPSRAIRRSAARSKGTSGRGASTRATSH